MWNEDDDYWGLEWCDEYYDEFDEPELIIDENLIIGDCESE